MIKMVKVRKIKCRHCNNEIKNWKNSMGLECPKCKNDLELCYIKVGGEDVITTARDYNKDKELYSRLGDRTYIKLIRRL